MSDASTKDAPKLKGAAALDAELGSYGPRSVTVRLVDALLKAIPQAPDAPPYASIEEALALEGELPEGVADRARELAGDPSVDRVLFAAKSIDTGDTGITILTGVRSALSLFLGDKGPGAGADAQQRADAALKALGVAYLATQLLPRGPKNRVGILEALPAGRALILYYAAIEVAVPFGPEAASGRFVTDLVEEQSRRIAGRLLGVIGRKGVADAQETLQALTGTLDRAVVEVAPHADELANTLKGVLPSILSTRATAIHDVVAAGADALPSYRYLAARLAAETRIGLARWEAAPESEPGPVEDPPPADPPAGANDSEATASGEPAVPTDGSAQEAVEQAPVLPPPPAIPAALVGRTLGGPADALHPIDPMHEPAAEAPPPEHPERVVDAPGEHDLSGVYLRESPWGVLWLVFTREGVFSNHPPDHPEADWVAHAEKGHQVGTYQHVDDTLEIRWPGGRTTTSRFERQPTAMIVDGERCQRCDWNLDGHHFSGRYAARDGDDHWTFAADGTCEGPRGPGRYTLGVGALAVVDAAGSERVVSLYSTLAPDSGRPDTLWIGGEPYDRASGDGS